MLYLKDQEVSAGNRANLKIAFHVSGWAVSPNPATTSGMSAGALSTQASSIATFLNACKPSSGSTWDLFFTDPSGYDGGYQSTYNWDTGGAMAQQYANWLNDLTTDVSLRCMLWQVPEGYSKMNNVLGHYTDTRPEYFLNDSPLNSAGYSHNICLYVNSGCVGVLWGPGDYHGTDVMDFFYPANYTGSTSQQDGSGNSGAGSWTGTPVVDHDGGFFRTHISNNHTWGSTCPFTGSNTSTATPTVASTSTQTVTASATDTATRTSTSTSTKTATSTATNTATDTRTMTASATSTATRTSTSSATSTQTNGATATSTMTSTPGANTSTSTSTSTLTSTFTSTLTVTNTVTKTQTQTSTSTGVLNTATSTNSATVTDTQTMTSTPGGNTSTSTLTPTVTTTSTSTFTITNSVTNSQTVTNTPTGVLNTATVTNTSTGTQTQTVTSTQTETVTSTQTQTVTASQTQTNTMTPMNTSTWTMTATVSSTPTLTFTVTNSPTITFTPTFTFTPTITWTPTPTAVTHVICSNPYPNPVTGGSLKVDVTTPPGASIIHIEVFTTAFRKVSEHEMTPTGVTTTVLWDLNDRMGVPVADGLYYVRIRVTGGASFDTVLKVLVLK